MKIKLTFTVMAAVFANQFLHADTIGLVADASYWYTKSDVEVRNQPLTGQLESKGAPQLSLAFEHPIPLLPNIKIKYVNLDTETKSNQNVQAKFDASFTDYILYYGILDNIVDLDFGIGATRVDGEVNRFVQNQNINYSLGDFAPLAYVNAGFKLPFTGMSAKAEASYSKISNEVQKTDIQAEIQYNFVDNLLVDVGLKAGYRLIDLQIKKNQKDRLLFDFQGPYIGFNVNF